MTLQEAATELGVEASTLRWQIRNGRLRARKVGPVWTVTPAEVQRYRDQSLGRSLDGRPPGPAKPATKPRRKKAVAATA